MGEKPFIKFYPSDFLGGTSGLSPAERGVYMTLLCLMYEQDGPIPRDDGRLARRCGSPKAAFIRAVECLIDEGKLTEVDGMLSNNRVEKAIVDRANRVETATIAANQRWDAQKQKSQTNQRPDNAQALPEQCQSECQPEPEPDIKKEPKGSLQKKRGTRLPDNWFLPLDWGQWAVDEGYTLDQIKDESDRFKDYWIGAAGQKGLKLNWFATWRNWVRNSKQRKAGNGKPSYNGDATGQQDRADPALENIFRLAGLSQASGNGGR